MLWSQDDKEYIKLSKCLPELTLQIRKGAKPNSLHEDPSNNLFESLYTELSEDKSSLDLKSRDSLETKVVDEQDVMKGFESTFATDYEGESTDISERFVDADIDQHKR